MEMAWANGIPGNKSRQTNRLSGFGSHDDKRSGVNSSKSCYSKNIIISWYITQTCSRVCKKITEYQLSGIVDWYWSGATECFFFFFFNGQKTTAPSTSKNDLN